MIEINANDARREAIRGFSIVCEKCGLSDIKMTIGGAEEHGEVGTIEIICRKCGQWEYGEDRMLLSNEI